MRLITKTTLLYLFLALLVFGFGGWMTYAQVKKVVKKETDYSLRANLRMLSHAIEEGNPISAFENRKVHIQEIPAPEKEFNRRGYFTDTMAVHPSPHINELEPFRKLTVVREINGRYYWISIMDVFIESDDMSQGVFRVMTRLFLLLSIVLLVFSFLISRQLFRPFEQILDKIGSFDLKNNQPPNMPDTNTREFKDLGQFILQMTDKAIEDYQTLKEFSENASHEMQTPIAIAKGKLELLQGMPEMSQSQLQLVQEAQQSLNKLSRLGQALTLLTKINNREFSNPSPISLSEVVQTNLDIFDEVCQLKGLRLEQSIQPEVILAIDSNLADILVNNLIKNAIQHNVEGGWIKVSLDASNLVISNSGEPPQAPTAQLFERFRKSKQSSASLGLGLAIVKKICERNGLTISYDFAKGVHMLKLSLS